VQWTFSSFTTGTITFQLSDATGSAYNTTACFPGASPYTLVTSVTTTNGSWFCPTGGAAKAQITMSGGGGTATVSANASGGNNILAAISSLQSSIPAGSALIGNVGGTVTPAGATQITASATGTTAATTATLSGTSGKTTYICSMSVRANATAATTVTDTITGVIAGTLSRTLWVAPLASGLGVDEMVFNPCVAASGTNQAIAVVSGAPGTGGTVSVNATGYQM